MQRRVCDVQIPRLVSAGMHSHVRRLPRPRNPRIRRTRLEAAPPAAYHSAHQINTRHRSRRMRTRSSQMRSFIGRAAIALAIIHGCAGVSHAAAQAKAFDVTEATIEDIHAAYKAKKLNSHQLVQLYLDRINAYDKNGP